MDIYEQIVRDVKNKTFPFSLRFLYKPVDDVFTLFNAAGLCILFVKDTVRFYSVHILKHFSTIHEREQMIGFKQHAGEGLFRFLILQYFMHIFLNLV